MPDVASSSPTLEGFRAIVRNPSLVFAEIAWRWSFGAAALILSMCLVIEYLKTLSITRGDHLLLRSRHPLLVAQALGNIVRGSGVRLVEAGVVLLLALLLGWIVIAALGRAATLKMVLAYFGRQETQPSGLRSLMGLNFLRAAVTLAAVLGSLATFTLLDYARTPDEAATVFNLALLAIPLIWLVRTMLDWFLSLASVFVVADGAGAFAAIADAGKFFQHRAGAVFAVGTAFGLAHFGVLTAAGILAAFPLGFITVFPGQAVVLCLAAIALLYFAVADFFYVGRLAAYVSILTTPDIAPILTPAPPAPAPQSGRIDPDELILCDVPAPG